MRNLLKGSCLVTLIALAPGVYAQQAGLAIDHKEVSCIVAGKFPKMNACFAPGFVPARFSGC